MHFLLENQLIYSLTNNTAVAIPPDSKHAKGKYRLANQSETNLKFFCIPFSIISNRFVRDADSPRAEIFQSGTSIPNASANLKFQYIQYNSI